MDHTSYFTSSLETVDEELNNYIKDEYNRQKRSLELIASENYTSLGVIECLGSCLTNKYSEGQIGRRYYGGNENIDKIELLCKKRALQLYKLDDNLWHVNVQPYSGSPANFAVYTGLLKPHDRIMGLDLSSGGHLTHGFYSRTKKVSASSIYFESLSYHIKEDGLIDYDDLEKTARRFMPKLLICGASAYPRHINYEKFREIADNVGALLMCDMAHISGIVAGYNYHNLFQEMQNPFDYCHIVTTTTHKTLGGPRSGMIFCLKNIPEYNLKSVDKLIDDAVFPALQGGPHNHQIAGLAYQLKFAMSNDFKEYINNVVVNTKTLELSLKNNGFKLSSDGSDTHLILVKLEGLSGSKMEFLCELCDISLNKNSVYGDKNPMFPTGIRIGTSAMTIRGFNSNDFKRVGDFIKNIYDIGLKLQDKYGRKMIDFIKGVKTDITNGDSYSLLNIKEQVNKMSLSHSFY